MPIRARVQVRARTSPDARWHSSRTLSRSPPHAVDSRDAQPDHSRSAARTYIGNIVVLYLRMRKQGAPHPAPARGSVIPEIPGFVTVGGEHHTGRPSGRTRAHPGAPPPAP
ncbi:hypothetical protein GCM10025865_30560 [Paraoerskovia sediminicola]|uniref:Uncharacterized protein n=1 Tax=Paraoerskovia sediminicola TaxID=1138587 RepID=A0ABM8G6I4_9CELL|nr:hypothetical protein GCM10025865_30560 [Paraoerskovia sediminicola]